MVNKTYTKHKPQNNLLGMYTLKVAMQGPQDSPVVISPWFSQLVETLRLRDHHIARQMQILLNK